MSSTRIDKAFAIELLRALHQLDQHFGELDNLCTGLPATLKDGFVEVEGKMLEHILFQVMEPIYGEHPQLGSPSEPGSWLADSGVRE